MPKSPQQEPRRRRDLTLRPQSEAELDNAAQITSADVLRAQSMWARDSSVEFRHLLDAQELTDAEAE